MLSLSRDEARRFLVLRHHLAPARALPGRALAARDLVRGWGALQFDPLEVPGARNHDLVMHARVADYARADTEAWLYAPQASRCLVEVYNKSLNIVPLEDLAAHRFAWERAEARHRNALFRTHRREVDAVLARLRDEGPTATRALSRDHQRAIDWYWAPTSTGRAVLEALFETGQVAIMRREGNARIYDLTERCIAPHYLAPRLPRDACIAQRLLTRHRSMGLLARTANTEVFVALGDAQEREAARRALCEAGAHIEVRVEGHRDPRHIVAANRPLLEACTARLDRAQETVSFLAPLDPLLWDRRLVESLFDFRYRWEVYTAEEKREHGYYVLPVLFGDRIVGRIEPVYDRRAQHLTVKLLRFVDGFAPTDQAHFLAAFTDALADYARFVNAREVTLGRTVFERAVKKQLKLKR